MIIIMEANSDTNMREMAEGNRKAKHFNILFFLLIKDWWPLMAFMQHKSSREDYFRGGEKPFRGEQ